MLFTNGNKGFHSIDNIYNVAFGAIVIIFILFKVLNKTNSIEYSMNINKKKSSTPPSLNNKPLHPK